ncbi:MAG: OmpA family protein [Firmicutes bacterium]|nr:OmpA family protein [Bacillota bacterium]
MMKRAKKKGGGANWQDTYGDMVTLLLCFFVLLYSISTVDQVKWANLVRSFNPDAKEVSQVIMDTTIEPGNEEVPGSVQSDQPFDEIYDGLVQEMEKLDVEADVQIVEGEDFQFISYRDKVFFDGDSPVLKKEGKKVLDAFAKVTKQAADSIKEIRVMGHTSQADPKIPNDIGIDRLLSSERSANVVAYIQKKNIIDPANLVSEAYGQFHPIDTFETRQGREKNRRCEILILEKDTAQKSLADYYAEIYGDDGGQGTVTPDQAETQATEPPKETQATEAKQ